MLLYYECSCVDGRRMHNYSSILLCVVTVYVFLCMRGVGGGWGEMCNCVCAGWLLHQRGSIAVGAGHL